MTLRRQARTTRALLALSSWSLLAACAGSEIPTVSARTEPFVNRVRAEGTLSAVNSTVLGVPSSVQWRARIAWMAEDGQQVKAGDVVLRFDPREMERNLEGAQGDLRKSVHEGSKTVAESRSQNEDLDKNREMADLELDVSKRFQYDDDEIFSRHEIIESRIDGDLAQTRKEHATAVGSIRQTLSEADRELVDIGRRLALQRIEEAQDGLNALEVRAPHDGLLIWTRDWRGEPPRVGAEVYKGNQLGTLPSLEEMNAEVYVLEADAGGIEPGQRAVVTVEARPEISIAATVASVGAVSEPRFRGSPVRYFSVILRPDATDTSFMKPGQRVTALITLTDRAEALVIPRQAIERAEGQAYVYVRKGRGFERRDIQVGPTSIALAVVDSGLEPGDEVALENPSQPAPSAKPETPTDQRTEANLGSSDPRGRS